MGSLLTSSAGSTETLRVDWPINTMPQPGDVLLARLAGSGGWVLRHARRLTDLAGAPIARLQLRGLRFDGAEPALAIGCTVWPWGATGAAEAPRSAPLPGSVADIRPVSIVTEAQKLARAKAMQDRNAVEGASPPRRSAPAEWSDPDSPVSQKVARMIKGRRRCDAIGRLAKQSSSVTREHIAAMEQIKLSFDCATIGMSRGTAIEDRTTGTQGQPTSGPSATALRTLEHQQEIARLFKVLGCAGTRLLRSVVLENRGIAAWCEDAMNVNAEGRAPDRKLVLGALLQVFDRCVEFSDEGSGRHQRVTGRRLR